MKRLVYGAVALALILTCVGSASAQGFMVFITVDENGHGRLTNTNGFNGALPSALLPDPGPGGLPAVLTYDMLNPPGLVAGDVLLQDGVGGPVFDVIRFNPQEVGPGGGTGCLLFYSDNVPSFDALGDTPSPPGALYPNNLTIVEVGTNDNNRALYTPTAGQPGFVAGAAGPVNYTFISDVPEPASFALLGIGAVSLVGFGWLRRKIIA